MSLRTFIHGLVSGTKSNILKTSTSTGFETGSSESENPSKNRSPESSEDPYRAAKEMAYDFLPMFCKFNEQGINVQLQ